MSSTVPPTSAPACADPSQTAPPPSLATPPEVIGVPVSDPAYAALTTSQRLRVEFGSDGSPTVVVDDAGAPPKLLGNPVGERVFKPVEAALREEERRNAPTFHIEQDAAGGSTVRTVASSDPRRFVLSLEFQFRVGDELYSVTKHLGPAPNGAKDHYAYHLWREQHGALEPVRLGKSLRQRLLSARNVCKEWPDANGVDMHELEPEGRHDKRLTVVVIRGVAGSEITQQTYVSLGTTSLSDSDWIETWYVTLNNAHNVAGGKDAFDRCPYIEL